LARLRGFTLLGGLLVARLLAFACVVLLCRTLLFLGLVLGADFLSVSLLLLSCLTLLCFPFPLHLRLLALFPTALWAFRTNGTFARLTLGWLFGGLPLSGLFCLGEGRDAHGTKAQGQGTFDKDIGHWNSPTCSSALAPKPSCFPNVPEDQDRARAWREPIRHLRVGVASQD
jgi:hypothetical protein